MPELIWSSLAMEPKFQASFFPESARLWGNCGVLAAGARGQSRIKIWIIFFSSFPYKHINKTSTKFRTWSKCSFLGRRHS